MVLNKPTEKGRRGREDSSDPCGKEHAIGMKGHHS